MISLEAVSQDSYELIPLQSVNTNHSVRKAYVYECKESERDREPPERIACPGFITRFCYKRIQVFPWPPNPDACHCDTRDPAGN
jgi:hypothetical protein